MQYTMEWFHVETKLEPAGGGSFVVVVAAAAVIVKRERGTALLLLCLSTIFRFSLQLQLQEENLLALFEHVPYCNT